MTIQAFPEYVEAQRLQDEALHAFGHVVKNTFIDDMTSSEKLGSPAERRVRSVPARGEKGCCEQEAPLVINLSQWRPSRVSAGRSGRSGGLRLPIGRSDKESKCVSSPSSLSKGEVSPFSSLLADFGDLRDLSPKSTSCGNSSDWESSDGSFSYTTPTIANLTSRSSIDTVGFPVIPVPPESPSKSESSSFDEADKRQELEFDAYKLLGMSAVTTTTTETSTPTNTDTDVPKWSISQENGETLADWVEKDCRFLRISGRDFYDEENQLRRKRGVVKSIVFYIKGLPWAKRARWLMPLLWSVASVLKARGCTTRVQAGELYVQLSGMREEEYVRVDFAAAR